MAQSSVTIIESQADWLTGACETAERADALRQFATALAMGEEEAGNKLSRFAVQSYQGQRCGRVACAEAEGGRTLIQLSGDLAAQHLRLAAGLVDHITRLDLAVTVRTPGPDKTVAVNAWTNASWYYDEHPRSAAPWRIQHKTKGDTTYIGSRNSDKFLRVYDKYAESLQAHDAKNAERYLNCWRYEIEIKGKPSGLTAARILESADQDAYVRGAMTNYLRLHGIVPIYSDDSPAVILPGFTRRSDADSRLFNLARNVRPSLDWLRDAGYAEDALAALGIDRTIFPREQQVKPSEQPHPRPYSPGQRGLLHSDRLPADLVARTQPRDVGRERPHLSHGAGGSGRGDDGHPTPGDDHESQRQWSDAEFNDDDDHEYAFE